MATLARAFLSLLFAISTLSIGVSPAAAQESVRLGEQDIKAGLLYNFLRYTHWPSSARADAPLIVCLYGGDPFSGRLSAMAGRTVSQRPIEVRQVRTSVEAETCSLVYVNAALRTDWPGLRAHLARRHVLTVSDYDGFARAGGMIEFARSNERIAVRINVGAAQAADLVVQDRLLRLATVVRSDGR